MSAPWPLDDLVRKALPEFDDIPEEHRNKVRSAFCAMVLETQPLDDKARNALTNEYWRLVSRESADWDWHAIQRQFRESFEAVMGDIKRRYLPSKE